MELTKRENAMMVTFHLLARKIFGKRGEVAKTPMRKTCDEANARFDNVMLHFHKVWFGFVCLVCF